MSWFWILVLFVSFSFGNELVTEASKVQVQKKLPSAVVVGTVYCDTCFHQDISKSSHFIAGATVAIECKDNASSTTPSFRKEVKTNKHGEFQVHLPFSVSKHVRKIKSCSVELIRSNEPFCAVAAAAKSSSLNLKSRKQGKHIFSAGFFTFKPLEQPEVCNQKIITPEKASPISNPDDPSFPPPLQDPPATDPPLLGGVLPLLPPVIPQLPPILPKIPLLPPLKKEQQQHSEFKDSKEAVNQPTSFPFPPNPFNPLPPIPLLPPPSLFPPIPGLQPPPSVLPPIFPTPPPSIFPPILPSPPSPPPFSLPPLIPGLVPSPPPPPPPFLPIPFPPFPFQPTPGFPGVPPAAKAAPGSKASSP